MPYVEFRFRKTSVVILAPAVESRAIALTLLRNNTPVVVLRNLKVQTAIQSKSRPSLGFLGLDVAGSGIVKRLIESGYKITVFSLESKDAIKKFVDAGASSATKASDVVLESDVTFSFVSDPRVTKELILGDSGALSGITSSKAYVEISGCDVATSKAIADVVASKSGRFLEVHLQALKEHAAADSLIVFAAGDRTLFDDCQHCFQAIGRNSFYVGSNPETAYKSKLALNLIASVEPQSLSERMSEADVAGLQQGMVDKILGRASKTSHIVLNTGNADVEDHFPNGHLMLLERMQLLLDTTDQLELPLPLVVSSNDIFKRARRLD